uniref:Uncharacterized protein n=1 Tax=Zea mays TaxID=4577 RepID=B6T0P7_MAIZE|nr:hypothetical protein [Zea mays]
MVRVATYFAMTFGAFLFWQSMDRVHVWIALHQDEKKERMERELEIKRMQAELLAQARMNHDCHLSNGFRQFLYRISSAVFSMQYLD